jgi:hypothetical protein
MGLLDGKVAFISGVARGQARTLCVWLSRARRSSASTSAQMILRSDAGRYITGPTVVVDAGFTNRK